MLVRLLKVLGAAALLLCLALLVVIDQFGYAERAQPADAIVVLGSMVYPGGRLGPSLERRAAHAATLYQRGLAPVVLCSGGVGTNPPAEALVACNRVIELGVPVSATVLEDESHNTEQNAAFSARILRAHGWRSAIVVSDGYHLFRVTLLFEAQGVSVYPSPAQATSGAMNPIERVGREIREVFGVLWYWLRSALGLVTR